MSGSNTVSFGTIRLWDGSQDRAFEELCYQLRDETPANAALIKTGDPDGGLEWYFRFRNGIEHGWQAKYTTDTKILLDLMERSLKTVVKRRPNCRRLTFCIPYDLPDAPGEDERKSARQKYEDRKVAWRSRIDGADRVAIELWQAGDLLDRLALPQHRGRQWFFWGREVFSPEWCRERIAATVEAAGDRYSPQLHVQLPVAFALEGLGRTNVFWDRYRHRRDEVRKAARDLSRPNHTGLGITREFNALAKAMTAWDHRTPESFTARERLPAAELRAVVRDCVTTLSDTYPAVNRDGPDSSAKERKRNEAGRTITYYLSQLRSALQDFDDLLSSPAGAAAERGALLITGDAGQGKTHLLCDAAERAASGDRPAAVLLGGRFSGRTVWRHIAELLGLGDVGMEVLRGAMRAAAEASEAPFLLLIDALNEAADATGWREELPALLADLRDDPWIVVGLSLRSSYEDYVLPPPGRLPPDRLARVIHPGFSGRELEATERFFDAFGLEQPRIPLLRPEFTNPLFLKLYCEGLRGLGLTAAEAGHSAISDVFDRYLRWKAEVIVRDLNLDPLDRSVQGAVDAIASALVVAQADTLPYQVAKDLVQSFAPHATSWPNTLFARLLSEGVLSKDLGWDRQAHIEAEVIRFAYQRFTDHRIAEALLRPFQSADELRAALLPKQPLREQMRGAGPGWVEALALQVPERFGIELLDAARWRLERHRAEFWLRAHIQSLASRRVDAITDRSLALLERAERHSPFLSDEVLDLLMTVAPDPAHALNSARMHPRFMSWSMPERDLIWSMRTYHALDSQGPLDRLIRWAARGPYPQCPDEVIELAAIPLIWVMTTPNRTLRDQTTKALGRLLFERTVVLARLIERFQGVNDPYVLERLAVIAHGLLLTGGEAAPDAAVEVMTRLRDAVLRDVEAAPNVITRDAVRGAHEWGLRKRLIDDVTYRDVAPPYESTPPERPRTLKQLEKRYERWAVQKPEVALEESYWSLFGSIFSMGDFGRYVIESKASRFTRYPLGRPLPPPREPRQPRTDKRKLAAFLEALPQDQIALADHDLEAFVGSLTPEQGNELLTILQPPAVRRIDRKREYPEELAQRWVFERVLSLGWTPERFGVFDSFEARSSADRTGHKPERFGKKYQWIAVRELIARISDNFHMRDEFGGVPRHYEGPWQFFGRDIDPTLPPPTRGRDEEDVVRVSSTFPTDDEESWWQPPALDLGAASPVPKGWALQPGTIPEFRSLIRTTAPDGSEWAVLHAYYNWNEPVPAGEDRWSKARRHVWSHIYTWLVAEDDCQALTSYLESRSFMNRWMPEGPSIIDDAYLAEMPWAAAANEYPVEWQQVEPRGDDPGPGVEVLPSWAEYQWEGAVYDCSISDSVFARMPGRGLFDAGGLQWEPASRAWRDSSATIVARYMEAKGDGHGVLLVREQWLDKLLRKQGWALVLGWLGEKQILGTSVDYSSYGGFSVINGVASFRRGHWTLGHTRVNHEGAG